MSWWSRFFLTRGTNNIDTLSSLPGFKNIIHAKDDNDEVTGLDDSDKDDRLYGGRGNDILNGEGGDDRLYGGSGDDTLNGGTGDDQLRGDRGNDTLNGGWGEDYLAGGTGDDILNGGGDNDKLYGNSGDDTLNGDEGDDKLVGGSGDDTMSGGDDNDHLSGNSGDDVMNGDAGNDKIYGGSGDDEIDGGEDDDTISGGSGNDTILGGDGDDVIKGDHGNDTIDAGAGNDKVYAGSGNDTVTYNFEDNDGFENYLDGGSGKGDVLVFELDQMQLQELMDTGALEAFDETHPWRVFDFGDYVDIDLEVIGFEKLEFEILNAPPVAVDDENCITDEEEPVSGNILMNDSDPDMDMLTLNTVAAMDPTGGIMIVGLYGTLSIDETGAYTYDLDDDNTAVNALGVDDTLVETFSYEIQDIAMQTAVANLNITIKGINDPPDAVDDIECIDADAMPLEISVLMNDTDPDNDTLVVVDDMGDPLMIGVMQMGMFGDLEYTAGGVFTYTVEASAVVGLGVDEDVMESFTYYISDGNGGMDSASIEITIKGVNDQPTAVMDEICIALMDDTGMGNVLSNDTDPDTNDMLMVTNVNGTMVMGATMINGMYGTLTINEDGSYTYNIDETNSAVMMLMPGDDLTDTFSYDISDGNGGTSSSQLEVTLKNNNMPPTANRDMFTNNDAVLATAFLLGNIVSNDTEPDMQVLSVSNVSNVNITIPTFLDMFGDVTVGSLGISGDQIARFSLTPDMELANEVTLGGMEPPAILTIESDGDVFLTKNSAFDFIRDNMTDEIVITFDYTVSDPGGLTDDSDVTITLSPTDNNDTFFGLDGVADTLLGGAGSDVIRGFSGNDTLEGNAGDDIIDGGTGTDLARYNSMFPYDFVPSYVSGTQMANNVVFNFMDLNASDGDEGTDTIISIEQIVFGEGITYDVLLGDQGSQNFTNPLIGSSAVNDLIIGFEGNLDVIIGDVQDIAANTILASTSHDMIFGISNISSRLYGDAEDVFGQITTAGDDYFLLDNAGGKVVVGDVRGISLQANSMGDAVLVNAGDDRIISFASSGVNVYGDVETIRPLVILPHSVRLENAGDDFIDMNG
ncbi:MAG: Ig-like domain-containing protein, partial [Alphaproteobacteria bacterium]